MKLYHLFLDLYDRIKRLYYQTLRKRDFEFMEKGILANKEHEFLVAGWLEFD